MVFKGAAGAVAWDDLYHNYVNVVGWLRPTRAVLGTWEPWEYWEWLSNEFEKQKKKDSF